MNLELTKQEERWKPVNEQHHGLPFLKRSGEDALHDVNGVLVLHGTDERHYLVQADVDPVIVLYHKLARVDVETVLK